MSTDTKAGRRFTAGQKQVLAWRNGIGSPVDWMSNRELAHIATRQDQDGCLVNELEDAQAVASELRDTCEMVLANLAFTSGHRVMQRLRAAIARATGTQP